MGASTESESADERQIEYLSEHRNDWYIIEAALADELESKNFCLDIRSEEDDESCDFEP